MLLIVCSFARAGVVAQGVRASRQELEARIAAFDDTHVFARFKREIKKKFDITDDETAMALRREALRYLTLSVLHPDKQLPMFSKHVDEYWHTFILFTREYFTFCKRLGVPYIHHQPNVDKSKPKQGQTLCDFARIYEQTFGEKLPEVWLRGKKQFCTDDDCGSGCSICQSCSTCNL